MWNGAARKGVVVLGLGACLFGTGCAAAGEVGAKLAVGLLEAMLRPSSGGSSTPDPPPSPESEIDTTETPCRKRLLAWQKAVQSEGEDAPAHLRCKPNGEWPDEEALRAGASSGF